KILLENRILVPYHASVGAHLLSERLKLCPSNVSALFKNTIKVSPPWPLPVTQAPDGPGQNVS
ncbi:hypothetical protein BgiMline_017575, partial [Biomphalaria glabrata]